MKNLLMIPVLVIAGWFAGPYLKRFLVLREKPPPPRQTSQIPTPNFFDTKDQICAVSVADPVHHPTMIWFGDGRLWVLKWPMDLSLDTFHKLLEACQKPTASQGGSAARP